MIKVYSREEQVARAFKNLGRTPREGQVDVVLKVLAQFLDHKKENVILCLDTGAGKSIIAAAIGEVLRMIENPELNSVILMHQNSLTSQYYQTFKNLPEDEFFQIKGARNYSCEYSRYRGALDATAEECVKTHITDMERDRFCKTCEYSESRKLVNKTQNLITNYSYFFLSKLSSDHLDDRNFHVFDEAHLLNDIYCSHAEVDVSVELLDKYIKEALSELPNTQDEITKMLICKKELEAKEITDANYIEFLERLNKIYANIGKAAGSKAADLRGEENLKQKIRYLKIENKYRNKNGAIKNFLDERYEHVFVQDENRGVKVQPIFIREAMESFRSKYNLYMSATLSDSFAMETFGLSALHTAYVTAKPTFDPKNRPIFFLSSKSLNYSNMQEPETIRMVKDFASKITKFHDKQKGLVMVPSFKLGSVLAPVLAGKVFEHKPRENLIELIKKFKEYKGQAVLISPSLYEGLDFAGDTAEYQILVKTPFASLGDKRIKRILDVYPDVYSEMTLYKILQGMGRSVRNKTDVGVSYFIDGSSKRLYYSKANIWKERYEVQE